MSNDIHNLSAKELFDLARKREQEEWEKTRSERQAKIRALRAERKSLQKRQAKALKQIQQAHAAELATIDSQIAELTGKSAAKGARRAATAGVTATGAVMDYLGEAQQASSKAIKAAMEDMGAPTQHVSQTLAYLVRQGQIERLSRGLYRVAA
ncbi:hypothetical protein SAMN05216526_1652 [Ectothiorhodosinus mongolicus]|uniref:AbiEi antitoxin N-terminal domain-containing protein n=1 Tax=Ectothiorhodosinus mongolicus TaxID=233100 RepID=A0A1R3W3S6_9GAMM|nr:type IV toxin-antitoxin system AbiEi family antitoxin domain-containing protein [Ectothiorhodosinus mongolicus]ULX57488.1 hypothetical protein CKX93_07285 [Ectothiorhodosinus mongolicus]SIT72442.1 hypothetical protein SAMN05216526_1652 [Ectothiorhodosinus mongolicus]